MQEEDFETKRKNLFESLASAEKSLVGTNLEQKNRNYNLNDHKRKRSRDEYVEKYKHKDSMFKRPALPINKVLRSRQKPDYEVRKIIYWIIKNPHWILFKTQLDLEFLKILRV